MANVRVVEEFNVSKSLLGQTYKVSFSCPYCNTTLKASEARLGKPDTCPSCHATFQVSPAAQEQINQERQQKEHQSAEKQRIAEETRSKRETEKEIADANKKRCVVCGKKETMFSTLLDQFFEDNGESYCQAHFVNLSRGRQQERELKEQATERQKTQKARQVVVTTTPNVEGFRIIEYGGIDGVEVVLGTGLVSELVTEVNDIFGGRSHMFESKLREGRQQALKMLQMLAVERNANAVVGIDFDYSQFSSNRTAIIVTGTFVNVVPTGPPEL